MSVVGWTTFIKTFSQLLAANSGDYRGKKTILSLSLKLRVQKRFFFRGVSVDELRVILIPAIRLGKQKCSKSSLNLFCVSSSPASDHKNEIEIKKLFKVN